MQSELAVEHPDLSIQLSAINTIGFDSGLEGMADLGDLPLFQDNAEQAVKENWGAGHRDVVILNQDNEQVAVFNLTTHNLAVEENYEALKSLLIESSE